MKTIARSKQLIGFLLTGVIILSSCASSKPYYKTTEGKRKQKYYNDIQFGGKSASQMKKKF
jgi:hypothetical protein